MDIFRVSFLGEGRGGIREVCGEGRGRGVGLPCGISHFDVGVLCTRNLTIDIEDVVTVINTMHLVCMYACVCACMCVCVCVCVCMCVCNTIHYEQDRVIETGHYIISCHSLNATFLA